MSQEAEVIKKYAKEILEQPFDVSNETEVRIGVSNSGLLEIISYKDGKPDKILFQVGAWEADVCLTGYAGLYMIKLDGHRRKGDDAQRELFVKFQKGFSKD